MNKLYATINILSTCEAGEQYYPDSLEQAANMTMTLTQNFDSGAFTPIKCKLKIVPYSKLIYTAGAGALTYADNVLFQEQAELEPIKITILGESFKINELSCNVKFPLKISGKQQLCQLSENTLNEMISIDLSEYNPKQPIAGANNYEEGDFLGLTIYIEVENDVERNSIMQ